MHCRESGSVAVFCPTSNLFLGSGLFDYQRYRTRDNAVRIAAATDVGGGTNYSMLRTMDEAYKVVALNGEKMNPLASFWQITRGNAEALSLADRIGTLEVGTDADITVLDAARHPSHATADGDRQDACRGTVPAANPRRRPGDRAKFMSPASRPRAICWQDRVEDGALHVARNDMPTNTDLDIVRVQEAALVFPSFDEAAAFAIGSAIRERALGESLPIIVDIRSWDRPLFYAALPGSTASNSELGAAQAQRRGTFLRSTYRMVLEKARPDRTFPAGEGLDAVDYVLAGGGFPITVKGAGVIGVIAVSGLPERQDHEVVVCGACWPSRPDHERLPMLALTGERTRGHDHDRRSESLPHLDLQGGGCSGRSRTDDPQTPAGQAQGPNDRRSGPARVPRRWRRH